MRYSMTIYFMFELYNIKKKEVMPMTVQSVNNHDNRNRYLGLTIGGLVVGGAAGGIYGDNTKPWVKNGELTDTFIRNVDKAYVEENKKQFLTAGLIFRAVCEFLLGESWTAFFVIIFIT